MRIEIIVGTEDPQIYPLSKPTVTIGTHESSDIILPASAGVSRRHVQITMENDNYYVTDQGSSNGTFINEERLVPGRRTDFTSFFPLRLGASVLITLLSDEDASALGFADLTTALAGKEKTNPAMKLGLKTTELKHTADATKIISLRDLQKAKTETLVKHREENVVKRREAVKRAPSRTKQQEKESSRSFLTQFFAILLFGGALYYNFAIKEQPVEAAPEAVIVEAPVLVEPPPAETEGAVPQNIPLVPKDELSVKESFGSLLQDFRCTLDVEKYFCEKLKTTDPWGVALVGTSLDILIDGTNYFTEAKTMLTSGEGFVAPTEAEAIQKLEEDINSLAILLYVLKHMPADLDYTQVKDYKINLVFFKTSSDVPGPVTQVVAAFVPSALQDFKNSLKENILEAIKFRGAEALEHTKAYYRMY